ncbi:hypothetical protein DTX80_17475 [Bacilli bacterium]|uniref:hypothetical protein n=1 Tax=Oceanobacillus TaxID=182709 RepID=UPI0006218BD6|nr:hypothetical protein WH51_14150 [Bacilli bacterium VT-13-104]PZD83262.1 hypothetical protein DEJ64_15450 [Bacilli bacterium]PZD84446.1 hypothetical protein DEJ60_14530 [Bacilli bacterium]PZD86686.1 hypothetical protein DEJ66_15200 [Bacilli bacterium]RCO04326.1 hypothetical protein DTX80_17475 [Bacilli bacterium]
MSSMRVPKILKLFFNLLFILLFTFVAYNSFVSGETFNGIIFSVGAIVCSYLLIKETLVATKKKNMFNKEVILDKFIIERLKTSLSLSYLYLIVHLSISIFADSNLQAFQESATFALFMSFVMFMVAQIVQAFI